MKLIDKAKEKMGLKKSKGLVAKMKTRRAIRRVREDRRFSLYLCTLRTGLIFTPLLAFVSISFISKPVAGHWLESLNYYMKIVALLVTVAAGIGYIFIERSKFLRRMKKSPNKAVEPTIMPVTDCAAHTPRQS
jgi:putative copper export protein